MLIKTFTALVAMAASILGSIDKVDGQLKSVDLKEKSLVLAVGGEARTYTFGDDTKIVDKKGNDIPEMRTINDYKVVTPRDMLKTKVGETITVETEGGKRYAIRILLPIEFRRMDIPRGGADAPSGPDPMLNKPFPKFAMNTAEGGKLTNADLKGKVLLVDFWATWCGPCKMASPIMQKLHEKYASKGLVVIGANTWEKGDAKKATVGYAKEHGYKYRFTYGNDSLAKSLKIGGIPTMYVVDRAGKIRKVQIGYDKDLFQVLEASIKPLLAK